MSERVKSLVFASVEPTTMLGQQPDKCLPLHLTLAPSFAHDMDDVLAIDERLQQIAESVQELDVIGLGERTFGTSGEYRVRQVLGTRSLVAVHWDVLNVAHEYDMDLDMRFAAMRYNPHVSYKGGEGVAKGEVCHVTHLLRAQKPVGQKYMTDIAQAYPLGQK